MLRIHQSGSELCYFPDGGCSGSKVCINCWFLDCWIRKPNFYYELLDPEWIFSILDFWIQNAYFELRISRSIMVFSMDVLHFFYFGLTLQFMYYQKHQSGRLPNAPIQKFTKFHNPKCKKINVQFFYRDGFVFTQHCGSAGRKFRCAGRNCLQWIQNHIGPSDH